MFVSVCVVYVCVYFMSVGVTQFCWVALWCDEEFRVYTSLVAAIDESTARGHCALADWKFSCL